MAGVVKPEIGSSSQASDSEAVDPVSDTSRQTLEGGAGDASSPGNANSARGLKREAAANDSDDDDADELGSDANEDEEEERPTNNDDDDDDEEEEDEDTAQRKRRKIRRNQFLDVEAEVDDEDEDISGDEDELGREDGFIQEDVGEDEEGEEGAASAYRRIDRRREREKFTDEDAEKIAEELRERYGRSTASKYRGDSGHVPQQLLLPSVEDPGIFGIPTRIGREKEAVRAILRKSLSLQHTAHPLTVCSVFQRDGFPGRIYVEAPTQASALQACANVPNVYTQGKILKVPIKEYPDMFIVAKSQETELTPGTYVRVKRGKYAGDLAVVVDRSENGLEARLRLLPRLDYGRGLGGMHGEKRKRATASERPPQRLFDPKEAESHDHHMARHGANSFSYQGDEYSQGFLVKDFKLTMIDTKGAPPTLDEVTRLTQRENEEGIDLNSLNESLKATTRPQAYLFKQGEAVEVIQGEQMGMKGRVINASSDGIVTIKGTGETYSGVRISVPAGQLRKHFSVGDHVRVTGGNYKDDTGMVVSVDSKQGTVVLLSDTAHTEVTVFARDLMVASDTAGLNSLGKYSLLDLVQLNAQSVGVIISIERESVKVLANDGQTQSVTPASIVMKVQPRDEQAATDAHGRQVGLGDTVRETGGERRQGVILHLYHQYVFLQNREIVSNLGVFVTRVSQVATVATKGARNDRGLDLSKMNPAAAASAASAAAVAGAGPQGGSGRARINTWRLIGQRVSIGPKSGWKGMKGTVKDASDTTARVELEARNKVVSVDVDKLLFRAQGSDHYIPLWEFLNPMGNGGPRGGSRGFGGGMPPPRTPGGSAAGGRTPTWNGSGGKTPAAGWKTPAYNAGGRTPAYNTGGRTPAYNAGGRTPGYKTPSGGGQARNTSSSSSYWNAGGKTPSGGKTPAWSAGGKTPAADAGTPWDQARTPGASSFFSAATPAPGVSAPTPGIGSYDSAPTPGVAKTPGAAPTPAVWGDDDDADDAPQYEPESP